MVRGTASWHLEYKVVFAAAVGILSQPRLSSLSCSARACFRSGPRRPDAAAAVALMRRHSKLAAAVTSRIVHIDGSRRPPLASVYNRRRMHLLDPTQCQADVFSGAVVQQSSLQHPRGRMIDCADELVWVVLQMPSRPKRFRHISARWPPSSVSRIRRPTRDSCITSPSKRRHGDV